jgi:hypothetical protein
MGPVRDQFVQFDQHRRLSTDFAAAAHAEGRCPKDVVVVRLGCDLLAGLLRLYLGKQLLVVIVYSSKMIGIWPELSGSVRISEAIKHLAAQ